MSELKDAWNNFVTSLARDRVEGRTGDKEQIRMVRTGYKGTKILPDEYWELEFRDNGWVMTNQARTSVRIPAQAWEAWGRYRALLECAMDYMTIEEIRDKWYD